MSDPDEPDKTTAEPVATPSPTMRQSGWTCSLPREILSVILELLVEDKALRAIANVQSASSAMYTLATPYLYREIHLHPQTALKLFGQFGDFARTDSRLFHEPVPPDFHLVDLHICHRLQAFFAHTRIISFKVLESFEIQSEDHVRLKRYTDLITGLAIFDHSDCDLWPKLDTCDIDMYVGHGTAPPFREYEPVVEAIFTYARPIFLNLALPGGSSAELASRFSSKSKACDRWVNGLSADEITLSNFPLSNPLRLPTADGRLNIKCCDLSKGPVPMESLINLLSNNVKPLVELDSLVIEGTFHDGDHRILTSEEAQPPRSVNPSSHDRSSPLWPGGRPRLPLKVRR